MKKDFRNKIRDILRVFFESFKDSNPNKASEKLPSSIKTCEL